tara:strand:+ start:2660 stop:3244 length:585 start_codon:yes stop_codon:yes gene_type:complete
MGKLIGNKKLNIAVFISGRGSNLNNLIKFSKKKKSFINLIFVVSSSKAARGLVYAKKNNIKIIIFNYKKKLTSERNVLKILNSNKIKLICLAGFMKILSIKFIRNFKGKIINIHPSLLPRYKGLNTHERVIKNNEKFTGCTVHFVNKNLDSGKIIIQKKIKIKKGDTASILSKKVLTLEHQLYPKAIKKLFASL